MESNKLYYLSLIGVAVFAISGALVAGRKGLDWVGVTSLAFVTALGGGTIRDILLKREFIFWIKEPSYLWVILGSSVFTIIYFRFYNPPKKSLLVADALGLALFSIGGAQIAENLGMSAIIIVLMGVVTGAAGGVLRDIMIGEIPLLFRSSETLYSVAAITGIIAYLLVGQCFSQKIYATLIGIFVTACIRFAAIFWKIKLPSFHVDDS